LFRQAIERETLYKKCIADRHLENCNRNWREGRLRIPRFLFKLRVHLERVEICAPGGDERLMLYFSDGGLFDGHVFEVCEDREGLKRVAIIVEQGGSAQKTSPNHSDSAPLCLFAALTVPVIAFVAVFRNYVHVQNLDEHVSGPDVGPDLIHGPLALLFSTASASLLGLCFAIATQKLNRLLAPRFTLSLTIVHGLLAAVSVGLILLLCLGTEQTPYQLYIRQPNAWPH
jgi:hypothetical protein